MSPQKPNSRRPAARQDRARIERQRRAADIRRRRTATIEAPPAPARSRRSIAVAGSIALAIAAAAVVVVVATRDGGDERIDPALTAPLAASQEGTWAITQVPAAYRIVYRRDRYFESEATTTTEEHTVRRPFESIDVTKDGAPPGTRTTTTLIQNLGRYSQLSVPDQAATGVGTTVAGSAPPSTAAAPPVPRVTTGPPKTVFGDVRLDVSLGDLIDAGFFQVRERRTLLGRDCQVYRTGQSLEGSAVSKPTDVDHTDACIDASGLVLEEVSVEAGKVASHLTATEVDTSVQPGDDQFEITGDALPADSADITLTTLAADAVPAPTYWVPGDVPAGYQLVARYRIDQADVDASGTPRTGDDGSPALVASFADVYVSGADSIIIRQGPASVGLSVGGDTVRVGGMGVAQVAPGLTGTSLGAKPDNPGEWSVNIEATLGVEQTVQLAKGMHTVTGPPAAAPETTVAP